MIVAIPSLRMTNFVHKKTVSSLAKRMINHPQKECGRSSDPFNFLVS